MGEQERREGERECIEKCCFCLQNADSEQNVLQVDGMGLVDWSSLVIGLLRAPVHLSSLEFVWKLSLTESFLDALASLDFKLSVSG